MTTTTKARQLRRAQARQDEIKKMVDEAHQSSHQQQMRNNKVKTKDKTSLKKIKKIFKARHKANKFKNLKTNPIPDTFEISDCP
jgi:hypothetical protein